MRQGAADAPSFIQRLLLQKLLHVGDQMKRVGATETHDEGHP